MLREKEIQTCTWKKRNAEGKSDTDRQRERD